jgi:hypothetical protein
LVKGNQPSLHTQLKALPWRQVPVTSDTRDRGHGRRERRTLKVTAVAAGLAFPHAAQAIQIVRRRRSLTSSKWSREPFMRSPRSPLPRPAPPSWPPPCAASWAIEDRLHWVRDVTYGEDLSQVRTVSGPRVMAALPGHHHPATSGRHQHRSRPAPPQPTARPATSHHHHHMITTLRGPEPKPSSAWLPMTRA